jgi:hypothetical protein
VPGTSVMAQGRNIPQTIYWLLYYIIFALANFLLLAMPFYLTSGVFKNAGILRDLSIIMAPFLVLSLSAITQELVPTSDHLKGGLCLFFISIINSTIYVGMCSG